MEALEDVPYVAARAAQPEHLEQRKKRGSDRMRYIADTTEFQIEEPTIVTLGKFDGRHRGHQKLLRTMMELKEATGYPTAIFTFGTAPGTAVTGKPQTVITTNLERRANMEKVGIDYLVEYPFTEETRHMEPEAFVKDILAGRMHAREIVVGPDCSFGYKGAGSAELLSAMARDLSSTYIREELEKGNVEKANQLLGQPYAIHGEVVHGNHIGGSLLGFPTANILPPPIKRLPRYGVYVSRVLVDGVYYKGVTNIGLEGDIYGKNIEVQLLAFDRPEQKFTSFEELKERIEKDKEFANAYYENHPEMIAQG